MSKGDNITEHSLGVPHCVFQMLAADPAAITSRTKTTEPSFRTEFEGVLGTLPVPSPGAASLLAIAGLVASRRRR